MPAECLIIADFIISIQATQSVFSDLSGNIVVSDHGEGFSDFNAEVSVVVPRVDLNTCAAAGFVDSIPPVVIPQVYPLNNSGGIGVYGPIFVVVEDLNSGIDLSSLEFIVNSVTYTQDSPEITFLEAIGVAPPFRYVIRYIPSIAWPLGSTITVSVIIKDRAGNFGLAEVEV